MQITGTTFTGCTLGPYSGPNCDTYYADVTLLLAFDGSNGSTTFTDTSPWPRNIVRAGSTVISTAQSKFGGSSAYFDGNGDYLYNTQATAGFLMGTSDFTIESWVYFNNTTNQFVYDGRVTVSDTSAMRISSQAGASGFIQVYVNPTTYSFNDLQPSSGTWNHIAVVRSSNTLMAFLNGVKSSSTYTLSNNLSGTTFTLGTSINNRINSGSQTYWWFDGYLDEFRMTKGYARYTSNFTPPSAAFSGSCTLYDDYIATLNVGYRWRLNSSFALAGSSEASIGSLGPALLTKGSGSNPGQDLFNGVLLNTIDSLCLNQTAGDGFYSAPITVDGLQDFTVGLWLNRPAGTQSEHIWGTNITGVGDYAGIWLGLYNTSWYLQYGDGSGAGSGDRSSWTANAPAYVNNTPVFVVFYSGAGTNPNTIAKKIWINGVEYSFTYTSGGGSTIAYPNPGTFIFANRQLSNTDSFTGYMDDFFFTYGQLTTAQILQLYNYGVGI